MLSISLCVKGHQLPSPDQACSMVVELQVALRRRPFEMLHKSSAHLHNQRVLLCSGAQEKQSARNLSLPNPAMRVDLCCANEIGETLPNSVYNSTPYTMGLCGRRGLRRPATLYPVRRNPALVTRTSMDKYSDRSEVTDQR